MTQRLIHQGPGISFQLGYSLQMWRLRAVTLPPRSLCSDLLSRVGNLNTGVHVGLGPSTALPLLNRAGSWLIPLCQGGMRMQRNGLHPLCLHWALLRGGRQLLKDSSACPFPLCLGGHYHLRAHNPLDTGWRFVAKCPHPSCILCKHLAVLGCHALLGLSASHELWLLQLHSPPNKPVQGVLSLMDLGSSP